MISGVGEVVALRARGGSRRCGRPSCRRGPRMSQPASAWTSAIFSSAQQGLVVEDARRRGPGRHGRRNCRGRARRRAGCRSRATAALIARVARQTRFSGFQASGVSGVLSAASVKGKSARQGMPRSRACLGGADRAVDREARDAGERGDGLHRSRPSRTKSGQIRSAGVRRVSADHVADPGGAAQAAGAAVGKGACGVMASRVCHGRGRRLKRKARSRCGGGTG